MYVTSAVKSDPDLKVIYLRTFRGFAIQMDTCAEIAVYTDYLMTWFCISGKYIFSIGLGLVRKL